MRRLAIDFEALFQSMPTPFMVLDRDLHFVAMNRAYLAMTGRTEAELLGKYVFDAFPDRPERQEATKRPFLLALAGEENTLKRNMFAIERPGRGRQDLYWDVHHTPVRDGNGAVIGVLQHGQDVSAEVEAERMRDVLSLEYDHRVRNLMTKISAIARHTARQSDDVEDFLADFEPRISAMARTHELLVNGGWEILGLRALIDGELQPFASEALRQISINGPDCTLSSRVGQALGMALHELATNAAKYGALSGADGHLSITWWRLPDQGLHIEWRETGQSNVPAATSSGFGSRIIDRVLPLETGGSVERTLAATGLTCIISLPDPQKA